MLSVLNLSVSIGSTPILKDISLNILPGEMVGVIGPNGSGKTTLFNAISGFVPITNGAISFNGESVTSLPAHERSRLGIGRVFQNPGIFRDLTVGENIQIALERNASVVQSLNPWSAISRNARSKVSEWLSLVSLEAAVDKLAGALSGGQLRLLEMVRTLAFGAELFLLDEPTAGVSPKMKCDIERLIVELGKRGKTVLIIEHDLAFIQRFCRRIIVLEQGSIALDGTPEIVRNDPKLQQIYFGGAVSSVAAV